MMAKKNSREPGPLNLPPAEGFYPNRRDVGVHEGALKRLPSNVQHVMRFADGAKAPASGTFTSSPLAGYKKQNVGDFGPAPSKAVDPD